LILKGLLLIAQFNFQRTKGVTKTPKACGLCPLSRPV
jgi:hypothetical protein